MPSPGGLCFLLHKFFQDVIAQLSIQPGTIVRVRIKFAMNYYWNLDFHYTKVFVIDTYGDVIVTLTTQRFPVDLKVVQ